MKIENLKQLQKLIAVCRKTGVQSIKVDGIEFHLGQLPNTSRPVDRLKSFVSPEADIAVPIYNGGDFTGQSTEIQDKIDTSELTDEQLMMWSARPEEHQ
jgi:hypothetical protein